MLLIGLTGSIATGKSTVSSMLSSSPHSLPLIDADLLARQVVEPGTSGYSSILSHFSSTTPDLLVPASDSMPENGPTGKGRPLNRPALGRRVFGDSEERKKDRAVLNGIVHPAVRWAMFRSVLWCYLCGHWAVVLDVPLLFESALDRFCGTTLVVGVTDPAIQMQRLRARDEHLTAEDAENRVKSQTDVRVKAARSEFQGGHVVWNDGTKEELKVQVDEVIGKLRTGRDGAWKWLLLGLPPLAIAVAAARIALNMRASRKWHQEEMEGKIKGKL